MSTSVLRIMFVFACIAMLGSGCATIRRLCGPCVKKAAEAKAAQEAQQMRTVAVEVLDSNEVFTAEIGTPFDQLPIDADAKLEAIMFAYDSSLLAAKEIDKVKKAGQYLIDNPDRVMHVDGHCDERGSNEYNLSLGDQRAQSVRKILIAMGLDGARIQTRSFGKEKPLDAEHNETAWAKNRRGEFVVYIKK